MTDKENLELEPPKISDVKKIADLDDDIELHDNILDTITQIVQKRVNELEENEQSDNEEMSVDEQQDRLSGMFSHDGSGSRDSEDLSESESVDEIQRDLKRRIFDN